MLKEERKERGIQRRKIHQKLTVQELKNWDKLGAPSSGKELTRQRDWKAGLRGVGRGRGGKANRAGLV